MMFSARSTAAALSNKVGAMPIFAGAFRRARGRFLYGNLTTSVILLSPKRKHDARVAVAYFSAVDTLLNVVFRLVPSVLTTAMIAMEMPAAINPYSMAVAPFSSFTKRKIKVRMLPLTQ
jgi:hypothetical protein